MQLLILTAQPGLFTLQRLNLCLQIEQAAAHLRYIVSGTLSAALVVLLHRVHALPHLQNRTTCLSIFKQGCVCRSTQQRAGAEHRGHQRKLWRK